MELIVKIGADQQGLKDTIERMKAQFKSDGMTTPLNMVGGYSNRYAAGIAGNRSAERAAENSRFETMVSDSVTKKGISLLKANVFASLSDLVVQVLDNVGKALLNMYYKIDEAQFMKNAASSGEIRKAREGLDQARSRTREKADARELENASPERKAQILAQRAAVAQKEMEAAKAELDHHRGVMADLKEGKIKTVSGGMLGQNERQKLMTEAANAEIAFLNAQEKKQDLADQTRKAQQAVIDKDIRKRAKDSASDEGGKPMSFQADALAQAGLFAGSSLLFNPTFTIEMEQLEVLRRIEAHAARETGIFR